MSLQRIGVIGDVHAEDQHLATALDYLQEDRVDEILCVGDIVDGRGDADYCCELLQQANVITVRGNHDRWLLEGTMRDLPNATPGDALDSQSLTFLRSLPVTHTIETVAGSLLLCHGMGRNDMQYITADDSDYTLQFKDELQTIIHADKYRLIVNGHSHRRMARQFGQLTVVTAGTLGDDADYRMQNPGFLLLNLTTMEAQFYDLIANGQAVPAECLQLK